MRGVSGDCCLGRIDQPAGPTTPPSKKGPLMRRTMFLLATVGLALLLAGGVAVSKQRQETAYSESPATTTKSGGDGISAQSSTQKASSTSGSGDTFLRVSVSDAGNLLSFESPQGVQSVSREGYALCSEGFGTIHGYDIGSEQAGFAPPRSLSRTGAGRSRSR